MPWYKSGTVSVTQNSNAVIGTGTAFIANSRVGDAFRGPDGGWYEVTNIASDTAMSIAPNYQGATNAAGAYALAPMQGYVKDSADTLRALVNQFGAQLAALTDSDGLPEGIINQYFTNARVRSVVMTGLDLTITAPVLATDTLLAAIGKLQAGKAAKGANSDITELNALTKPINSAQGGVSDGYIEGLNPTWNSSSSITISSGAAFIQSSGKTLRSPATLTISGIAGLNPDAFYYVYLYDNAGTPAVELSTIVPATPYFGSARSKTGDTSRRFVCAVRSGAGGTLYGFQVSKTGIIYYSTNTSASPFRRLSGGTATTYTSVSLAPVIPLTSRSCSLRVSCDNQVSFLSLAAAGANPMAIISPGGRYQLEFVTDESQTVTYSNLTAGGSMFIDVCGYGMER